MESGTEVLRVTAAIVSAFQAAADTLEMVKDRKEKKKRKKDKEIEELMEIKILHKSLVEVNPFQHPLISTNELSVDFGIDDRVGQDAANIARTDTKNSVLLSKLAMTSQY
jgi:hypothetical protein